jgi:lipase chaperone LimK
MPVKARPFGRRRNILLVLVVAAIVLVGWLLWPVGAPDTHVTVSGKRRTVAESWRWETAPQVAGKPTADARPIGRIHPAAVARALGRVELDENGKVIVDRNARDVLEESFETLPDLTAEELDALHTTIRAGLPGPQGERVAKIVDSYYRYRAAFQIYERSTDAPTTPEGERAQLNYLAALRDQYLGPVVARQFYAEDQALQRFLIESKSTRDAAALQKDLENGVLFLDSRTSPAAKELSRQMEQLRAQNASDDYLRYVQTQQLGLYTADALPRTETEQRDWQQRYVQFKQERQSILAAGLTEEDKKTQIEQLLKQRFSAEELEAIRAYNAP